jgi:Fe-S cluster assembly protein SufB
LASKTDIVTDDYKEKYGFSDPVESYAVRGVKGLSERVVQEIVRLHDEPAWMEQIRMKALRHFLDRRPPAWAPDLAEIDFQSFYYYARPTEKAAASWDQLPEYIKRTYDKLGITEAEKKFLAGVGAVYESEAVYHSIKGELEKQGVVFTDTVTALKEYPDIMKKYFGTVVPYQDNYIAALQTAVWSAGSFVYVPEGVKVPMILQAYFRINERNMGQFERTLIVAEPYSEVSYNEGCLPAGELVSKGHSFKQIESVGIHELVATHEGRRQAVTHRYIHPHHGQMLTLIPQSSASGFRLTPEHPVLAVKRAKVSIRRSRNGSLPEVSTARLIASTPEFIKAGELEVGDFVVYVAPTESRDDPALTDTLLKILGVYLAEGNVCYNTKLQRDYLSFSFGKSESEKHLAYELVELIRSTGERASVFRSRKRYFTVGSYSKKLIELCRSSCGIGAANKALSERLMLLPPSRQSVLVSYYLKGDGNRYQKKANNSLMIRASTASRVLAFQLQEVLARMGMFANINLRKGSEDIIPGRKITRKDQYVVEYTEDKKWSEVRRKGNRFFVPIKEIKSNDFDGPVYNLGVQGDETYLVNGFAVHNCSAPVYSSQSLHSAVVEIIAKKGAFVKYTTLQNWSRDVLNLVTKRAHAYEEATVSWVDFNGGCLVEGTEVFLNNDIKHIEEIDVGSRVYSLDGELNFVSSEVVAKRTNPPSDVYRLTTMNHREVEATPNHPFLCLRKSGTALSLAWTPLSALEEGDLVAVSGELPDHGKPHHIEFSHSRNARKRIRVPTESTDGLMWLLGFYIGDGTSEMQRVSFCVPESDPASTHVEETLKELFGLEGKRHAQNKVMLRVSSKDFADLIRLLGVSGNAKTKRVPDWVFKLPTSQKRAFIDGYIAADGHVRKEHKNISIASANLTLIRQIKTLAISAGLNPSKISTWTQHAKFPNGGEGTYTNYFLYFSDRKVQKPLYFVPLTKVEYVGKKVTYDIEVAQTGNFVANGIIVHNSKLTRKYPSVYLLGPRAKADIISVAYAGPGQVQDTGGKAIHLARDTTSKIISRSVSKGGGHTAYRGLLHIAKGAKNVKSTVRCDALLLDAQSTTATYPYMEINEDDATVTHEASVGKVGEEQLFYLMSRGISEGDALSMVVNGFMEPFAKELPMAYAVEFNRLMSLEMTNAVG